MRCQYCGSTLLHPETQHKQFSTGKAVAGAVTVGVVGAAAGFIGKDIKGYKCGACGAFMEKAMDPSAEWAIDSAIQEAEAGGSRDLFDYFKKQYPNIQAQLPASGTAAPALSVIRPEEADELSEETEAEIKGVQRCNEWLADCPVYVEQIVITTEAMGDALSLLAYNQTGTPLRSVYFHATVYDDTGDKLNEIDCVYQNVGVQPGGRLPEEQTFPLGTDLAYRVELVCDKAALEDGSVWRRDPAAQACPLSEQAALTPANFPRLKYVRAELEKIPQLSENAPLYLPVEHEGCWQCICGHPAKAGKKCPFCGETMRKLKNLLSQERLRETQQKAVKARAAARAKEAMALHKKAAQSQKEAVYQQAAALQAENTEESLAKAIDVFLSQPDFKDSSTQADACKKRIEELRQKEETARKDKILADAIALQESDTISNLEKASVLFKSVPGWKDADQRECDCQKRIEELKERAEQARQRNKKIGMIGGTVAVAVMILALVITQVIIHQNKYNAAERMLNEGDYDGAIAAFTELGNFKDSAEQILLTYYTEGEALLESQDYDGAIKAFESAGEYTNAAERILESYYAKGEALFAEEDYTSAVTAFSNAGDYEDAAEKRNLCAYNAGLEYLTDGSSRSAQEMFESLTDTSQFSNVESLLDICETMVALGGSISSQSDILEFNELISTFETQKAAVDVPVNLSASVSAIQRNIGYYGQYVGTYQCSNPYVDPGTASITASGLMFDNALFQKGELTASKSNRRYNITTDGKIHYYCSDGKYSYDWIWTLIKN